MTVANDYNIITAESTATPVIIPISWDFGQDINNLFIIQQDLVTGEQYDSTDGSFTFSLNASKDEATINQSVLITPGNNTKYYVSRTIPLTQDYDLTENAPLDASSLETGLDDPVLMIQDLSTDFYSYAITSIENFEIPSKIIRANNLIAFDDNGDLELLSATAEQDAQYWAEYAEVWASYPEDVPIPVFYGGDGVTTFSSFHWAQKAEASASGQVKYFVGPVGTNAQYTTIQSAIDAAEAVGNPASIMILAGTYSENLTITQPGLALCGNSSFSNVTSINGNITYNHASGGSSSIKGLLVNGALIITGAQNTVLWATSIQFEVGGGASPLQISNTNNSSTLVLHESTFTETSDLAPAYIRTSGNMSVDGTVVEFSRNGASQSSNVVVDFSAGGTGQFLLENATLYGCVDFSGSSVNCVVEGGSRAFCLGGPVVDLTGYVSVGGSTVIYKECWMDNFVGSDLVTPNPTTNFQFANITSTNSVIDSEMAVQLSVDGIVKRSESVADGTFLDNTGNYSTPSISSIAPTLKVYTSNDTWTKPADLVAAKVTVIGGGGGGGGVDTSQYANGGGGGGCAIKFINEATLGAFESVTIGSGGAGGSTLGGSGGTSSFGSHCSASGGGGGQNIPGNAYGSGGSGVGGDINTTGSDGSMGGIDATDDDLAYGGDGGSSFLGGSTAGPTSTGASLAGNPGKNYGGGGSGAAHAVGGDFVFGGSGAGGIVIVEEYY